MATVTIVARKRTKGKSYIVQYKVPGTGEKKHHATYRTWHEADAERTKLKQLLSGGQAPEDRATAAKSRSTTFGQVAEQCSAEWRRRVKEGSMSAVTLSGYENFLAPLLEVWGKRLVSSLTQQMLLDYRADVAGNFSPALSNRRLFIAKQILSKALRDGVIRQDPSARIQYLSEKVHERKAFLLPEHVDRLLEEAAQSSARHYLPLIILLAVEHGCSRQELLDLKWTDINFDFQKAGMIRFYRTKNKQERVHLLMPRTRAALLKRQEHLQERRKRRQITVRGDHVLGHLDGTRKKEFRKAWAVVCSKLGIDDYHFHDNRHTFCTNILLAGGSLKHAAVMIGHKDMSMTDRYCNLEGLTDNAVQLRLAEHYAGPPRGDTKGTQPLISFWGTKNGR
ncbi:MAG TPA: site-specific integrase [Syntrophaceae bacterium]|nr:site-specific integrase [Syntrophaceae bacterium]